MYAIDIIAQIMLNKVDFCSSKIP